MNASNLKSIVRGAYDIQALRIQMGGRIVANFKSKLGMEPSVKEDAADQDEADRLRKEMAAIQNNMPKNRIKPGLPAIRGKKSKCDLITLFDETRLYGKIKKKDGGRIYFVNGLRKNTVACFSGSITDMLILINGFF